MLFPRYLQPRICNRVILTQARCYAISLKMPPELSGKLGEYSNELKKSAAYFASMGDKIKPDHIEQFSSFLKRVSLTFPQMTYDERMTAGEIVFNVYQTFVDKKVRLKGSLFPLLAERFATWDWEKLSMLIKDALNRKIEMQPVFEAALRGYATVGDVSAFMSQAKFVPQFIFTPECVQSFLNLLKNAPELPNNVWALFTRLEELAGELTSGNFKELAEILIQHNHQHVLSLLEIVQERGVVLPSELWMKVFDHFAAIDASAKAERAAKLWMRTGARDAAIIPHVTYALLRMREYRLFNRFRLALRAKGAYLKNAYLEIVIQALGQSGDWERLDQYLYRMEMFKMSYTSHIASHIIESVAKRNDLKLLYAYKEHFEKLQVPLKPSGYLAIARTLISATLSTDQVDEGGNREQLLEQFKAKNFIKARKLIDKVLDSGTSLSANDIVLVLRMLEKEGHTNELIQLASSYLSRVDEKDLEVYQTLKAHREILAMTLHAVEAARHWDFLTLIISQIHDHIKRRPGNNKTDAFDPDYPLVSHLFRILAYEATVPQISSVLVILNKAGLRVTSSLTAQFLEILRKRVELTNDPELVKLKKTHNIAEMETEVFKADIDYKIGGFILEKQLYRRFMALIHDLVFLHQLEEARIPPS